MQSLNMYNVNGLGGVISPDALEQAYFGNDATPIYESASEFGIENADVNRVLEVMNYASSNPLLIDRIIDELSQKKDTSLSRGRTM